MSNSNNNFTLQAYDILPDVVHDEKNYEYKLLKDQIIGFGGQGCIVRVKDPDDIAVKLSFYKEDNQTFVIGKDTDDGELLGAYQKILSNLERLPISCKQNITLPHSVLTDYAGYTLKLLSDSISVNSLIFQENKWKNSALPSTKFYDRAKQAHYDILKQMYTYAKTGGLTVRLEVLYQIAKILAQLHDYLFTFGDISPNNFMFEKTYDDSVDVWFIDVDNIMETDNNNIVGTTGFMAPEIASFLNFAQVDDNCDANVSIFSDCYSFALLCCNVLLNKAPFIGAMMASDKYSCFEEFSTDIDVGNIPWILDPVDTENNAKALFKYSLNKHLFDLLNQCFTQGRGYTKAHKEQRPLMYSWVKALDESRHRVITCDCCYQGTYFNSELYQKDQKYYCPICKEVIPEILCIYEIDKINHRENLIFAKELTDSKPIYIKNDVLFNHREKILQEQSFIKPQVSMILEKKDKYVLTIADNISATLEFIEDQEQQKRNQLINQALNLVETKKVNGKNLYIYQLTSTNELPYKILRNNSIALNLQNKNKGNQKQSYKYIKLKILFSSNT